MSKGNCTTCKHGTLHKFATGSASGKILCTVNSFVNYAGLTYKEPIKCGRYERKP